MVGLILLCGFLIWTGIVLTVDRADIGPLGTVVGLSGVNSSFSELIGFSMFLYTLTDFLSLIPIAIVMGFALVGAIQLFKRKSLFKVDGSILLLGGYYLLLFFLYVLFDAISVNYRPILINGVLEPSYPSSTTLLVICVDFTCAIELECMPLKRVLKKIASVSIYVFTVFMISARALSGVHWITDIIGGILLGLALVILYRSFRVRLKNKV